MALNLIMVSCSSSFHGMWFRMLHHLVRKRLIRYHGMSNFVVLEGLGLLGGFDDDVLGRDEPYRVDRHEDIRVVRFELPHCPCSESFGFGTPHDAELESWFFSYFGFLTCVGPKRNASCFCLPVLVCKLLGVVCGAGDENLCSAQQSYRIVRCFG